MKSKFYFQTNPNRADFGVTFEANEADIARNIHVTEANIRSWRYLNSLNSQRKIDSPTEEIWDTFEIGEIVYAPQFFQYPFILNEFEVFGMEINEYGVPLNGLRPIIFKIKDKEILEAMFFVRLGDFVNVGDSIPENLMKYSSEIDHNELMFFDELGYPKYRLEFQNLNNNAYVYDSDDNFEYSHDLDKALGFIENHLFAMNKKDLQIIHDSAFQKLQNAFPTIEFLHMEWTNGEILTQCYYVDGLAMVLEFGLSGSNNRISLRKNGDVVKDNLTLDELILHTQNQISMESLIK